MSRRGWIFNQAQTAHLVIDAARAGEQGGGLAAAAGQVRTLTSRTQSSTGEIQSIVSNLQSEFQILPEAVSNNADQMTWLSDVSATIAAISEEQKSGAQSIATSINTLNLSRQDIHATLEETKCNLIG